MFYYKSKFCVRSSVYKLCRIINDAPHDTILSLRQTVFNVRTNKIKPIKFSLDQTHSRNRTSDLRSEKKNCTKILCIYFKILNLARLLNDLFIEIDYLFND